MVILTLPGVGPVNLPIVYLGMLNAEEGKQLIYTPVG